jgi:hypothetical protein
MHEWTRWAAVFAVFIGAGTGLAGADGRDEAMAGEEAFWAARKAGNVKEVEARLAPGFESIESDCNGMRYSEGAGAAVNRLKQDLAEGAFGSYKLRRLGAQVVGQAVILSVRWESRFAPRVGGVRAVRYTAGVATVVWAKDATGVWKRFNYHSHWRAVHTHASGQPPRP